MSRTIAIGDKIIVTESSGAAHPVCRSGMSGQAAGVTNTIDSGN